MNIKVYLLSIALFISLTTSCYAKHNGVEKQIFGRKEYVLIFKERLKFKAKLDTGAKISSLSAVNIKEFTTNGKTWLSFQVTNPKTHKKIIKQYPLERYIYIKRHFIGNSKIERHSKRPVIMLPICLGNRLRVVEVNLVDRSHFISPVLLGADALRQFKAIVDPDKIYTAVPTCEVMS